MAADSPLPVLAVCKVMVQGTEVPDHVSSEILECVVDESVYLPSACTIRFFIEPTETGGLQLVDSSLLEEGNALEVQVGWNDPHDGSGALAKVFKGEIVATELDLNAMGVSTYTIRALDKSHRMHIGVNQKVYLNVTDSDCINQVVSENGMSADVDSTTGVRDWIVQHNQSDWEFAKHLAWRNGMRLYANRDETVRVKKFSETSGEVSLNWAEEILAFRPRTAATSQVSSVKLRSWDMKTKEVLIGQSAGSPSVPSPAEQLAGKKAGKMFKPQPTTICGFPLFDQGSATAMADALYQTMSAEYLKADVLCHGNPKLEPGVKASLKGVGDRFSGSYIITTATHVYGPKVGYTTQLGIDGGFGAGLDSMIGAGDSGTGSGVGTGNGAVSSSLNSANLQVCVGIVTSLNDPDNLGRIKVKFPFLAEESESFWARMATPMAGAGRGILYLPEVNDEVLIAFEHGDMHRPYMIGALWNGTDKPPEGNDKAVAGGQVVHRLIKTRIGHSLLFDDTDGKGQIISTTNGQHIFNLDDKNQMINATTTGKHTLTMDDQNKKIEVKTTDGHTLTMDDQGKKIEVKTTEGLEMTMDDNAKSITIKDATGNTIKIDGSANKISLSSLGDVSIKAMQNIELEAQMNFTIQGLQVSATAQTELALKGTAAASLQASGEVQIQGAMVMIN